MVFETPFSPSSGIEHNRKLGYQICERWSIPAGGSVASLMELFNEDAIITTMAKADLAPEFGGTRTKKEFADFMHAGTRASTIKVVPRAITAQENRVVVECNSDMVIGRHPYANTYCWVFDIKDGRISAARLYLDTLYGLKSVEWAKEASKPSL